MPLNKTYKWLFNKNTKLRRKREELLGVVNGHFVMAAKALVVNKPIAIFHAKHRKS